MSMAQEVERRLAAGEVVVIDGGTGTALQARGVPMDEATWCGRANLDNPEAVQAVHEDYIRAGADVVIANTFATNRAALAPAGLGDRVAEVNRRAVEAARRARDAAATGPVAIAGSMSPFSPVTMTAGSSATRQAAPPGADGGGRPSLADYREQAAVLAESGVDFLALEMIGAAGYGRAAVQAATETGLPVWLGLTPVRHGSGPLGTYGELPGEGGSFEELVVALVHPGLAAVTLMHAKADDITDGIPVVRRHFAGPIGAYAEAGDWAPPNWVFTDVSPERYVETAAGWVELGVQLVGGCCGIGPDHIEALARALPRHRSDLPPSAAPPAPA